MKVHLLGTQKLTPTLIRPPYSYPAYLEQVLLNKSGSKYDYCTKHDLPKKKFRDHV